MSHDDVEPKLVTQSMPVLNEMAGYLIGRGGQHAQWVQNSSGCSVHVDQDERALHRHVGHEWCYVRLRGNARQVDQAKKLLILRIMDWRLES